MFIVVTGPPASGKSTVSATLAETLGLPLIAKDTMKDVLIDVLGADDVQRSRELGRAAVAVLKTVVAGLPGAVIDSVWVDRPAAVHWLGRLPGPVVEVFCRCARDVLEQRYRQRASVRPAGNFDLERDPDELWSDEYQRPLAGPWRVIEVDTTGSADLTLVIADLRAELLRSRQPPR